MRSFLFTLFSVVSLNCYCQGIKIDSSMYLLPDNFKPNYPVHITIPTSEKIPEELIRKIDSLGNGFFVYGQYVLLTLNNGYCDKHCVARYSFKLRPPYFKPEDESFHIGSTRIDKKYIKSFRFILSN